MPRVRPGKTTLWINLATRNRLNRLKDEWKGEMTMDYIINDILDRLDDIEDALIEDPDLDQSLEEETYPEDDE